MVAVTTFDVREGGCDDGLGGGGGGGVCIELDVCDNVRRLATCIVRVESSRRRCNIELCG